MKSSILVPLILIVCLLALALLISQAFTASNQDNEPEDTNFTGARPNETGEDSVDFYDIQTAEETGEEPVVEELFAVTEADSADASPGDATFGDDGRFLVIAGTFRQVINARARVNDLKRAGFSETEMAKFDRGTFAVALVDRSNDYTEATRMAERVRSAGFEARVYRKR
ncbi:SPOR domain-containing protein [Lewinella sp. JB7]|uniref:SPOR domain-containing protein n=1 Tax=Lewinella sp. JB7 TaxID=2962887 RepID=UPI0020C9603E|nr:SPOR domain-containing protein [Lewinella sp. JB7]MCP9236916.1 SPOR domain-containing protein [Lewinella sp. JB7]